VLQHKPKRSNTKEPLTKRTKRKREKWQYGVEV
jgi:hypothetical protein